MNLKSLLTDKKMYQYHSWLGLIGGIFLLLISLSGTILTFGDEIDALLNGEVVRVSEQGTPKNLDEITASIKQKYPEGKLLNLRIYTGEPDKSIRAEVAQNKEVSWVYVNPYTTEIMGAKPKESAFIRVVFEFHEHLLLGLTGDIVLLLVGICFLGSVITGFIYYRKSLFQVFKVGVRFGKNPQIVNADLHKLLGVSALLFMLVMSATGVFFHFERVERALGRIFGEEKKEEKKQENEPEKLVEYSVSKFIQAAQEKVSAFEIGFIRFPQKVGDKLSFRGNRPESVAILGKFNTTVDFDINTSEANIFHAEQADSEYIAEHIFEELHFGRYGGKLTKTIYFLGGLATFIMVITGFVIWLRNKKS